MNQQDPFPQLMSEIIEVYETLISEKSLSDSDNNFVIQAIKFLKNIEKTSNLTLGKVRNNELFQFFSLLLDCIGLVSATKGSIQPLKLGDTTLIGRKRDLKGAYRGSDHQVRQNMCATLFQGWIRSESPQYHISKDLRCVAPKGMPACDFQVKGNGISPTLIECKRIHPSREIKGREELIRHIIAKAQKRINSSLEQFSSSEKFLKDGEHLWHLILDLSEYGKDRFTSFEDCTILGLLDTDEIQDVVKHLDEVEVGGLDEITICWSNVIYFEKKPRALVYNTFHKIIGTPREPPLNYKGWTIEFYPFSRCFNEYRDLRISSVARSRDWIRVSWLSSTDNLVRYELP